jgi:hypothetical protein
MKENQPEHFTQSPKTLELTQSPKTDLKPENETTGKLRAAAGCGPLDGNGRRRNAKERHTEEQIIYALRQAEVGKKAGDICREMGVPQQAFYSWKRRHANRYSNQRLKVSKVRSIGKAEGTRYQPSSCSSKISLQYSLKRLSLGEEGKAYGGKSQDFKPDRGNPAVRHYRGPRETSPWWE